MKKNCWGSHLYYIVIEIKQNTAKVLILQQARPLGIRRVDSVREVGMTFLIY